MLRRCVAKETGQSIAQAPVQRVHLDAETERQTDVQFRTNYVPP